MARSRKKRAFGDRICASAFRSAFVVSLLATATAAFGQSSARPDKGIRPTGSYAVSDIESISMKNGNLNLSIPLASLPPIAGGDLSWTISAAYNSKMWDMFSVQEEDPSTVPPTRFITKHLQLSAVNPWFIAGRYRIDVNESHDDMDWRDPIFGEPDFDFLQQHPSWFKVTLTAPDGATHELRPNNGVYYPLGFPREYLRGYTDATPATANATITYYSYDGSYLWAAIDPWNPSVSGLTPNDWKVYLPDGTAIVQRPNGIQRIWDTNGNRIKIFTDVDANGVSTTHFQDEQTGREIRYLHNPAVNPPFGQGQVQYQTVDGAWMSIMINFRSTAIDGWAYVVDDPFCGGKAELIFDTDIIVVDSIVLPQTEPAVTRQFEFEYNSDQTVPANYTWRPDCLSPPQPVTSMSRGLGSLSEMKTPSDARVRYSYTLDQPLNGSTITFPLDAIEFPRDKIFKKEIEHDGTTDTWSYGIADPFGKSAMQAPDGSFVAEDSYPTDPALQFTHGGLDGRGGLAYRTNQSDKVIIERKWRLNSINGGAVESTGSTQLVPFNPVVDIEFTTLLDPAGNPAKMSAKQFLYDLNGNVIGETCFDWFDPALVQRDAQGVPTAVPTSAVVLRTSTTSYYNDSTAQASPNVYHKRVNGDPPTPLILNAPRLSTVGPSQTEFHYDGIDNTPPTKGNLTKERRWEGTKWIQTTHAYDAVTGNRTSTTDPKNNVTQFFYDDLTKALPTRVVVDPLNGTGQQTTTTTYDFATGLVKSVKDPNDKTTTSDYLNHLLAATDPFGRPGTVIDPQGRRTETRYFDNARQLEVWSDLNTPFDAKLRTRTLHDQLGRVIKTESSEDSATYTIFSDTQYQQMGRIIISTNPLRAQAAPTDGWTRTTKDNLGRVVLVETFTGRPPSGTPTGTITTSYNANSTTVTDQAGKLRRSLTDGLGRLVRVDEPDNFGNLGTVDVPTQDTRYTYDSRGNLTQVQQGTQPVRAFVYDALSRLKQATNPESETISYSYDDNSNLQTKTDARSVVTNFTYDGLNRVATKTYSGPAPGGTTPAVTYSYDNPAALNSKGRLTQVSASGVGFSSSCTYSQYDVMGRVLTYTQTTDSQSYPMNYTYDLAGNMKTELYPSGRLVTMSYDSVGRLSGVSGQKTGEGAKPYASSFSYTAHGAVASMQLGNSRWEHTIFNSRLQPEQIGLGTSATDSSLMRLDYTYGGTSNNGNVLTQQIVIAGSLDVKQTYAYDELNRLKSATEARTADAVQTWRQQYDYDRWGNRAVNASSTLIPNPTLTLQSLSDFNTSNNRILKSGFGYDTAGNLTADPTTGPNAMQYDGENKLITYTKAGVTTTYHYDGDGRRVKKVAGTVTTIFVYNVSGQLIAEYTDSSQPPEGGGGTSYLTTDHLGSTRVVTKQDQAVKARYDYLPFGEGLPDGTGGRTLAMGYGGADGTRQKFTQKERDAESGLDYFLARYYSSAQGRFTSPDEFTGGPDEFYYFAESAATNPTFYADLTDPQSLNKYQYAFNNSLLYIDLDGHQGVREVFRDAVTIGADFGDGVLRGMGSSLSFGLFPRTTPRPDDSLVNRGGQTLGTILIGAAGTETAVSGGAVTILSGGVTAPISVPMVAGGVVAAGGALTNVVRIVTTPVNEKRATGSTPASGPAPTRIRYHDDVSKADLHGKSLTSGSKQLRGLGLKERVTKTGRHEFYDPKTGRVRAAYDAGNKKGPSHWHKFGPDGQTPLNNRGKVVDKNAPKAHIPAE